MRVIKTYFFIILFSWSFLLPQCKEDEPKKNDADPDDTTQVSDSNFSNPLLTSGPDPWVYQKDSFYYYTHTLGNRIGIIKTRNMSALAEGTFKTVWTPPAATPYSRNLWAPEVHFINDKWYIYFAADDGDDANHRMYVLENQSADPMQGNWEFKGKIADAGDKWAIDGSVFHYNDQMYFMWSGWKGTNNPGEQQIYMAKMTNPWTIEGTRVMISQPDYPWEKNGEVNEGPEVIQNDQGRLFLFYSASGCWTDDYSLGMLTLREGGDPLNPGDWTKNPEPVFSTTPENNAYGPGHNGFFKSPDGTEDWIIYHANPFPAQGCGNFRNPRIQKIAWREDGTPDLGVPVKINTDIRKPSGER